MKLLNQYRGLSILYLTSALVLTVILVLLAGCEKSELPANTTEQEKSTVPTPSKTEESNKGEAKSELEGLKLTTEEMKTAGVQIITLEEQEVKDEIVVTASIQANQDKLAHVAPRVAGKVIRVMANLGDKVKANQPLALIDSIEVGEAQSSYAQAVTEQNLAKASMERADKLYAEQVIPQKDYLRVQADFEKAKAVLRAANDKRQALGIAGSSSAAGSNTSVYSVSIPFAGTIIEKDAVLGELAQSDKTLFSIADLSTVWIETKLYEKDLGKIKLGAPALISTAAYPGETFKGKITYISSISDKDTHTVGARVEVPNLDGRLKLDMFATAAISTNTSTKALSLPEEAVVLIQGQSTVFVQKEDSFEPRAVDLGEKLRNRVILKSGISAGEKVVVSGAYALKAKMLKSQISAE